VFESLVNSRRCKTYNLTHFCSSCLRALLIQEGVKPERERERQGLRALLIQNNIFIPILPSQADNPIITELE